MLTYGSKDLQRLLGVSPAVIRSLVRAGYVSPQRGASGRLEYSFQDLVALRTVRSLKAARIPTRRILSSLKTLRRNLPESAPLAGLSITAVGDEIAVREGASRWEGRTGQYLLSFDVKMEGGEVRFLEPAPAPAPPEDCTAQFERALALEETDVDGALAAYRHCIAANAADLGAYINGGRLLHGSGRLNEAEALYRSVAEPDAVLLFNLAVLLEDQDRLDEAMQVYIQALQQDPEFADAHYNLARLYGVAGNDRESLRHLSAYRRLI
ncbi:MAG: tetratricopeptide repeat protein [Pseudomonadota bacterium]